MTASCRRSCRVYDCLRMGGMYAFWLGSNRSHNLRKCLVRNCNHEMSLLCWSNQSITKAPQPGDMIEHLNGTKIIVIDVFRPELCWMHGGRHAYPELAGPRTTHMTDTSHDVLIRADEIMCYTVGDFDVLRGRCSMQTVVCLLVTGSFDQQAMQ